jgi:DNA-directed RNA polymerase subunit alpha
MAILQEKWKDLIKTSKVEIKRTNEKEATFIVEPLERGYGTTLGNAIRRVLLTSVRGFAVTAIKIDGVFHEYDTIPGIREDVYEIIMNVKSLLFSKDTSSSSRLFIKSNKKGQILARDIKIENGGEILNKDLVICNIEQDGIEFNAEMTVEYGVGYVPATLNDEKKALGTIKVDAVFSPLRNATFKVNQTRLGQNINYDKLELKVETNGTLEATEAVALAAKILQSQLDVFINFTTQEEKEIEELTEEDDEILKINPSLLKRIDEIELSVRSFNCLKAENINYIGDLVQKTEGDMMRLTNFGKKSLTELKDNLKVLGLNFGMQIDSWDSILASLRKKRDNK